MDYYVDYMFKILIVLLLGVPNLCLGQLSEVIISVGANYNYANNQNKDYAILQRSRSITSLVNSSQVHRTNSGLHVTLIDQYESDFGAKIGISFNYEISDRIFISSGASAQLSRYKIFNNYGRYKIENSSSSLDYSGFHIIPVNPPDLAEYGIIGGYYYSDSDEMIFVSGYQGTPGLSASLTTSRSTELVYTQIPILICVRLLKKRLSVQTGLVTSLLTSSDVTKTEPDAFQNGITINGKNFNDVQSDNFSNIVIGGTLRFTYRIYRNLHTEIDYQYFLSPIYKDGLLQSNAKLKTLSFGVLYSFKKNSKQQ
jgi:hypothetical protein